MGYNSAMLVDIKNYRIEPGKKVRLSRFDPADEGGVVKREAKARLIELHDDMTRLQKLLYAEGKHSVLVLLQAMDAGGKDSTIRSVFGPVNPQGCKVVSFKAPNGIELAHDFLWRIHQNVPRAGHICVHNRSHYEDILIARVKNLVPPARWKKRYRHINDFEQMLSDEGTTIIKLFLHISKDYQKLRLQRRLDRPDKHWKFNPEDLIERERWDDYQQAYEIAMTRCNAKHAPWYVIPAENRWFRNLLISEVLVRTLKGLRMQYPEPTFDPGSLVVE